MLQKDSVFYPKREWSNLLLIALICLDVVVIGPIHITYFYLGGFHKPHRQILGLS